MFASAQAAEQAGDIGEAERFYSMLMKGNDPLAAFNLGNMLRTRGSNVKAKAALQAATRIDPTFAEAWYNLGDLVDEQGRSEAAIECLRKAVQVSRPATATQSCAEAAACRRRYLAMTGADPSKFCELQQHLTARRQSALARA